MGIKAFGVMCNCNDFLAPRPLLTQISKEVTHGVIEERVSSSTTAYTVHVNIRLILTECAEMLKAYKIRDVYSFGLSRVSCVVSVIKHKKHVIASWQFVR